MRRTLVSVVMSLAVMTVPATALPVPGPAVVDAAPMVAAQEPAVVVPEAAEDEEEQPWTSRFLVPTALAMTAVVLAGVAVGYGVRLRGRYRVVR